MINYNDLPTVHKKVIDLYRQEGHVKAWNYWRLLGYNYGILVDIIPSDQFIRPAKLCDELNVTQGDQYINNTAWFKFIIDGKIMFSPRYPVRNSISYDHLYDMKCVNENDCQVIEINGDHYQVTLFHGSNCNDIPDKTVYTNYEYFDASEWNRLIFPISRNVNDSSSDVPFNIWAKYKSTDLCLDNSQFANGCWTQEAIEQSSSNGEKKILIRGLYGPTGIFRFKSNSNSVHCAWRPLLRKID